MLRFLNNDGAECIPDDLSSADWHKLCGQRTVQMLAGHNIKIESADGTLVVSADFADTPESRYQRYVHNKQLAMAYGNEKAGVTNADYSFEYGYVGTIYAPGGTPYVKTIQSAAAADDGNLAILSSECVGVNVRDGNIVIGKDGSNCDPCESYVELNAFIWRLYHALNDTAYHLLGFDPTRKYWGTLMSYQGTVARWNTFIWQQCYQFRAIPLRDTLTIELSYTCLQCVETNINIHAVLTLDQTQPAGPEYVSSSYWLALYAQGDSKRGSFNPTIKQTVAYDSMTLTESGYGSDPIPAQWRSRTIDITIPEMHQNDYYTKSFVLSLSQQYYREGASTYFYLPEPSENMETHTLNLKVDWISDTQKAGITKQDNDIHILALKAYSFEPVSSSSGASA